MNEIPMLQKDSRGCQTQSIWIGKFRFRNSIEVPRTSNFCNTRDFWRIQRSCFDTLQAQVGHRLAITDGKFRLVRVVPKDLVVEDGQLIESEKEARTLVGKERLFCARYMWVADISCLLEYWIHAIVPLMNEFCEGTEKSGSLSCFVEVGKNAVCTSSGPKILILPTDAFLVRCVAKAASTSCTKE